MFFSILCGWMLTFLYLAKDMDLGRSSKVTGPLQLMNRKNFLRNIREIKDKVGKKVQNVIKKPYVGKRVAGTPKANEHDVIDMRTMSAELPFANENGGKWTQGWDVRPVPLEKSKPLKIFVVPHSHCDPGWIKTFDDYFQSQTKHVLSAAVESLMKEPKRKFIWAEISYFEWWWREQSEETRNNFRGLLESKRFEFVTGGWVQPDEANTQLYAMEIQLEEGHDFIRKTFGSQHIPKYGWSIDPFGYSPTMAYLLKKLGFKGMLIQRVHYAVKKELALHKNLEFMWRQTWDESPDGEYDIFTHVMPFYSYDIPHTCGPDPSVCCQFDFARMPQTARYAGACPWNKPPRLINNNNVEERSLLLLDQYRKKANLYRSNVVLAPLGDDFRYRDVKEADFVFENYEKILDYINDNVDNVEISFGTLSEYFETVFRERSFSPPVLKGSFFTYSDREEDYWSGYFTSRIFDKALDRKLERVLYAASSMGGTKEELQSPRRALSLFQHHDGVTGTAKSKVVEDYAKRIHEAIKETQAWILNHLVADNDHGRSLQLAKALQLQACWQSTAPRGLSQNMCDPGGQQNEKIIVYNPLSTEQSCGSVVVPGHTIAHAKLPCEVPGPLGDDDVDGHQKPAGIRFDDRTGLMTHPVREEWMVWKVTQGGAYLFFPGTLESYNEYDLDIQQGGSVVVTKNWKRTVVERKLPKDEATGSGGGVAIDFVYETNLQTNNEEWFARFTAPDIQNQGKFYTDLNGYNIDTHVFRTDMPIQSQVFPMPTLASIEDSKRRMTVLSEHAQGAASLEESAIDVWLDRRLAQDDARGLDQGYGDRDIGVKDNVPTRTRLRVVLEDRSTQKQTSKSGEFEITPFCKRQWMELDHPLEMFGATTVESRKNFANFAGIFASTTSADISSIELANQSIGTKRDDTKTEMFEIDFKRDDTQAEKFEPKPLGHNIAAVYMVHNRVDYLKRSIDTLRESDYPKILPIVISHDGHVPEVVEFVEGLKSEFNIIQVFHPYSCYDHPDTFPGNDPKLNENYKGDTHGNPRDSKITCCKHHFTWLMNAVFSMEKIKDLDGFLFLEEDYIVAPTIYQNLEKGFTYIDSKGLADEFFGLTLDLTDGFAYDIPSDTPNSSVWIQKEFVTGPMAFRRDVFAKIQEHARDYCEWDDYNWDWSIVRLMSKGWVPFKVLVPGALQVAHIGLKGGMHEESANDPHRLNIMKKQLVDGKLESFNVDVGVPHIRSLAPPKERKEGWGGWGHPADQEHCLKVFPPRQPQPPPQ